MKKGIVKRKGHEERYDSKKVYASVYAAALNCEYPSKISEKMAQRVMKTTNAWFKKASKSKASINSHKIKGSIVNQLKRIDKDIALMYEHHLNLS